MNTHEAFAETIKRFDISLAHISRETGIAQATLSRFKNGRKDIGTRTLHKIILALPSYAQEYFYTLWARNKSVAA